MSGIPLSPNEEIAWKQSTLAQRRRERLLEVLAYPSVSFSAQFQVRRQANALARQRLKESKEKQSKKTQAAINQLEACFTTRDAMSHVHSLSSTRNKKMTLRICMSNIQEC